MKSPRIPSMVTDIIQTALGAFDGAEFIWLSRCPVCGGPVSGYDFKKKRFAVLMEQETKHVITIRVKRFTCTTCKSLCYADEPFYPGTRIGSPVIDIFFTLCTILPKNRAARVMEAMGIIVDRTTWRNYPREKFPNIPAADVFGMRLPFSVITLSTLASRTGEGDRIEGAEALAACGFPSSHRAAPDLPPPSGKEGDDRYEQEQEKERQPKHPQDSSQDK